MKTKPITKERILQISNDIAEDMGSYTKKELIQVVLYFKDEADQALANYHSVRDNTIIELLKLVNGLAKE
jgi:hypothetical protein